MFSRKTLNSDPKYIGKKYGRLTVIGFREIYSSSGHYIGWDCKCDCGNTVYGKRPNQIKSGETNSCGCLKEEQNIHNLGEKRKTHGKSKTRLYSIWSGMKRRCFNSNEKAYPSYGGRGISICSEWLDFQRFQDWALNNGYKEKLTIERIDTNGNYCPENCAWIPLSEQAKNKRNIRYVFVNGEKMPLKTACEILGLPYKAIHLRITRYGMNFEDAIKRPF